MKARDYISFIWNGGLDPATADIGQLRRCKTITATALIIVPVSLILIYSNLFILGTPISRVMHISVVGILAMAAMFGQAHKGWHRFAGLSIILSFWIVPTSLMLTEGFSSSNWAWMLPSVLMANLVSSRRVAVYFTGLSILSIAIFAFLAIAFDFGKAIDPVEHAKTVAISGSLIFVLACVLGHTYKTTQIKIETQLRLNVKRLGKEVETRRKAQEAAMAGERAKATFLATVSHELRTPLNGVIGAGQLLSCQAVDKEQQELIKIVTDSGEILLDLINNVLDMSRMEAGRLELENQAIDLKLVIESGIAPLRIGSREKNVSLEYEISPELPQFVIGDANRLRQIILNLCGNALKFTEKGHVKIHAIKNDNQICLQITDTGIGISQDKIQTLFQPFTQAESSTARRFGGSGLGLTIVSQLVDLMDGSISIDSQPGMGSTFTVLLPLRESRLPEALIPPSAKNEVERSNADFTVLVTDDNLINRTVANKMLQQLGYNVVEATDGLEAIDSVCRGNIDLILMDVQMPNMDGLTATSRIRGLKSPLCDVPIVGLTAHAMASDRSSLIAAGMDDYLSKPVNMEKLKRALESNHKPINPAKIQAENSSGRLIAH